MRRDSIHTKRHRPNFSGRVNTYGNRGTSQSTVRGNYTVAGNDPAATQLALMRASYENRQLISSVQGNQAAREAQLSEMLLRSETIRPGGAHSGRLQVQLPPKLRSKATQAFNLAVNVGGEDHHSSFTSMARRLRRNWLRFNQCVCYRKELRSLMYPSGPRRPSPRPSRVL